jgi:hypothetical protein
MGLERICIGHPTSDPVPQPAGDPSPQSPGVLVARWTPRVRKCHQMSPKEHIQLGWVVRWAISTHPGPPHGWAVCTCRASTSLAPLYSPCASSAFDWGSKPHSRSAPAPVESSPGLVLSSTAAATGDFRPARSLNQLLPNRDSRLCTASQPCVESAKPPPSPTKSREDGAWACFRRPRKRKPQVRFFGWFHRI